MQQKKNVLVSSDEVIRALTHEGYKFLQDSKATNKERDGGFHFISTQDGARGYFSAAMFLAKKFGVTPETANFIVTDYIARSKKIPKMFHSISLPAPPVILAFAKFGACAETLNALAAELARCGSKANFKSVLDMLKRKPTEGEVEVIVKDYVEGASESETSEKELIELARTVSDKLGKEIAKKIAARKERLRWQTD